jgi:soluble lytic murein transglycosylase
MIERKFLWVSLLSGFGLLMAAAASRQVASNGPGADTQWAWHTAQRLRPVIDNRRATLDEILDAAEAELALGRTRRARAHLERVVSTSARSLSARALGLSAEVRFREGAFLQAGEFFSRAAERAVGVRRGVWRARAGDAFERGGRADEAMVAYAAARRALPTVEGWIAIRVARLTHNRSRALALLDRAPRTANRLAAVARGEVFLKVGDSAGARRSFAAGGDDTIASRLAVQLGDSGGARRHAYAALRSRDTVMTRVGLEIVEAHARPTTLTERLAVATAMRRLGRHREAARVVQAAVADGDSSAGTLLLLGDLLADAGQRSQALEAYAEAAAGSGGEAEVASYRRARLLIRMGNRSRGYTSLLEFAEASPERAEAPFAVFLVAEARRRAGRHREADSLYRSIGGRWPRDTYAGRARLHLASAALQRRDTAEAEAWYRAEIAAGGAQRSAAQFLVGLLRMAAGDDHEAKNLWAQLALVDSLGYYGTAARRALGLPPIRVPSTGARMSSVSVRVEFQRLDVLRQAFPESDEVTEFVRALVTREDRTVSELLDVADGLIERGWISEGIGLGWQAARQHTLHDPRVLRIIYPWPLRELIETEGAKFAVDPHLLAALIRQESSFLAGATSRAGARGLMQLMPGTAAHVARRIGVSWNRALLGVADANLHVGAAHLSALLGRYDGDYVAALAAYNAGGRPVSRWLRFPEAGDPYLFVERIPYVETRNYVKVVLRNLELYRALYPRTTPAPVESP